VSRIKLLQSAEVKLFDAPPVFSPDQRLHFLSIDEGLQGAIDKLRHPFSKIGFLLQWGYFRSSGRFFEVTDFAPSDIDYLINTLAFLVNSSDFDLHYSKQMAYYHREQILDFSQWKPFDELICQHQIQRLVERQLMPRKILFETQSWLFRNRMQAPAYDKYLRIINDTMLQVGKRISQSMDQHLTEEHRQVLDEFLAQKAVSQPASLIEYRTINQSTRPKDIEWSLEQFKNLKSRLALLDKPLQALQLSDAVIDYHAYWATIANVAKIEVHSDKYLFLLCFLIHQVRKRHDFFIDILLQNVKAAENFTKRLQKEDYFQDQKQRNNATRLLIKSRTNYREQLWAVRTVVASPRTDSEKIFALQQLLEGDVDLPQAQEQQVGVIENEVNRDEQSQFYRLWEKRSSWLSNRVGGILRNLLFSAENADPHLLTAVEHYTARNGRLTAPAKNLTWLEDSQQNILYTLDAEGKDKFRAGLYKMFLFEAVETGIKSGTINFCHSYRYRFLEEYLIDKVEWYQHRTQLLEDAGLTHFADCKSVIGELKSHLGDLYHQVNNNHKAGKNVHLTFNREGKPLIATPAVEKFATGLADAEKISSYFRSTRYVSILSLLSDVEKSAPFLHLFGHQSKTDEKKRPSAETFFAAILALGCNIGVERMGRISKGIQAATLKHTADWYLTEQALQDANDALIAIKNNLALPDIHRKTPGQLHTASDGQKILLKKDSLNATFSAKYPGFTKAASINTAIDERFATFYSAVITAADREAGNVPDMHLGNPIIKSTTHSTDTHGGTEVIFGMMHFLGIFFAPRIKDLGTLDLYSFTTRREYEKLDYAILPDHYIHEQLIETHWDDILRLMVSLKLGKTTAFQVLKRMNSYAQ